MTQDDPDLVLLQEVPVWAAELLREHTGMGVTLAPTYGAHIPFVHVPLPLALGAAVGRALPDLVRTQVEGQAQAVLYGPALLLVSARRVQLNERTRLRGEPRIAQLARLRHRRAGRELAVANVHADRGGDEQLEKAGFVLERFARGAPMVLGGDLNAGLQSARRARAARPRLRRGVGRRRDRPPARARVRRGVGGDALAAGAARPAQQRLPPGAALRSRPGRRGGGLCLTAASCRAWTGAPT